MSAARDDDRPGLAALLDYVRTGDSVVWKLDRLGRNTLHISQAVKVWLTGTDGVELRRHRLVDTARQPAFLRGDFAGCAAC